MLKDRSTRVILAVAVGLLALNLLRPAGETGAGLGESAARAQNSSNVPKLFAIGGQRVTGLVSVTALGDGRSFVVANQNGFQVYQVIPPDATAATSTATGPAGSTGSSPTTTNNN